MYWREEGDFVLPKTKQNAMKIPALTMQQQKQQIESEQRKIYSACSGRVENSTSFWSFPLVPIATYNCWPRVRLDK